MDIQVEHDLDAQRFFVMLEGEVAVLDYHLEEGVLDFYHTYVPTSARGKGIAEKIVKAGFEYAKAQHFKVIPSCPYISDTFLRRYSEYRPFVQ